MYMVGRSIDVEFCVSITNTGNQVFWVMLTDQANTIALYTNSPPGNFVGVRFSQTAGDLNYQLVSGTNNVVTAVNTGMAGDTSAHRFQLVMNDTLRSTMLYIDGQVKATNTVNYPTNGTIMRYAAGVLANTAITNGCKVEWIHPKCRNAL
jgi:hypothetical protein